MTQTEVLTDVAEEVTVSRIGRFEFGPSWLTYAPVVVQWIWRGLRHGDMSLPTAANPHIETGGLCGESKAAILDLVQGDARSLIAPYIRLRPDTAVPVICAALQEAGIAFPAILKPDIGCNGAGVRLVADAASLAAALASYPAGIELLLQRFIPWEGEAGLFYVRLPGQSKGRVTSITLKRAPYVVGDGTSPLRDLVLGDPRAGRLSHLYLPRLAGRLDEVPRKGERVRLVLVGNHCRGSIFSNGANILTAALSARVGWIADAIPEFHFGRFDVRFETLSALRRGEQFSVIEINGVGSEATHIWDPRTSLGAVWRDQLAHYGAAWDIGRANRARGFKTSGLLPMYRAWRRQKRLMAAYPVSD